MKKALLSFGIILIALAVMAPANTKAEKLKIDGNNWDSVTKEFTIGMLCQFGMATAAEANGKFTVLVNLGIVDYDDNEWDYEYIGGEFDISKLDNAEKVDGFIAIDPAVLEWNGDDDGSGNFKVDVTLTLLGPNGNPLSTTTVADSLLVPPPVCPSEFPCTAP